jgi:NAD(P)-dependent dehydrogenase (short-subunit alcohol dehydrogenase family)
VADHRQAARRPAGLSGAPHPDGRAHARTDGRPDKRPVALVTGARRGIGRGIAWALADAGFDLALCDLVHDADAEATEAGLAERGARCTFHLADIADVDGHAALVAAARSLSGRIDCLVNNAGVPAAQRGDLLALRPSDFDRVMAVNLRAPFFLAQAVARAMLADAAADANASADADTDTDTDADADTDTDANSDANSDANAGSNADTHAPPDHRDAPAARSVPRSIVTVSSISATHASPERAEYCLSKSALPMMTRLLALRLADAGIAAWEVRPGIVRTPMTAPVASRYDSLIASGGVPARRWGEPGDVGRVVAALASGALPFVTGDAVHVDGGLHIERL